MVYYSIFNDYKYNLRIRNLIRFKLRMGQTMSGMCCCNRDSDEIMKIALGEECDTILKAG